MSRMRLPLTAALLVLMPAIASAHPAIGDASGLAHGLMHPVSGMDHVLAMVTAGLFAAHLGGRALWLVPASFLSMMAVGGGLGFAGVQMPFVEVGIALSVVVLGALVALRWSPRLAGAMGLVGLFALFHGHAHGAELPADMAAVDYAAGFLVATASLHAAGVALGLGLARLAAARPLKRVSQLGGAGIALAGMALLLAAI
jgi:urease accessory protein